MAPLIILLASFSIFWLLNQYIFKRFPVDFLGRASLALMLLFTGMAHFSKTEAMTMSMPEFIPYPREVVYLTGVLEILAAVGLLVRRVAKITGIALIVFFICILPANIVGSIKSVALGGMEHGPVYLYFRIPLQLFFIAWTFYFAVKKQRADKSVAVS